MNNLAVYTKRNNPKSVLFLTELILAIMIFALCMGICGSIFVKSYEVTRSSSNLSSAVFLAENAAEAFRMEDDPLILADYISGIVNSSGDIVAYYNRKWELAEPGAAIYTLTLHVSEEGLIKKADISIASGKEEIYRVLSTKNTSFNNGGYQ